MSLGVSVLMNILEYSIPLRSSYTLTFRTGPLRNLDEKIKLTVKS